MPNPCAAASATVIKVVGTNLLQNSVMASGMSWGGNAYFPVFKDLSRAIMGIASR
jgi:hypothetical protein